MNANCNAIALAVIPIPDNCRDGVSVPGNIGDIASELHELRKIVINNRAVGLIAEANTTKAILRIERLELALIQKKQGEFMTCRR